MSLNERKLKILQAIINDYISTAEPVGSRTIAKKYDIGISSATIRNEMSDLEEMGLIIQPYASAGRIPSDMGYRLYVDKIMKQKELNEKEEKYLQSIVLKNISQIDYLMEESAKALSMLTNYTIIISEPVAKRTKLKQVRLVPLDSFSVMLVVATEENYVKNHIIRLENVPPDDVLYLISNKINSILKGCTVENLNESVLNLLIKELGEHNYLVKPIFLGVKKTIHAAESMQIHLSGTKNILTFPEFSDVQKAKNIFQTLEAKDVLVTLFENGIEEGVQILIGNENSIEEMKDCSVIKTPYKFGDNIQGQIGAIGPTRMDYSQVVTFLNAMVKNIEHVLKIIENKERGS